MAIGPADFTATSSYQVINPLFRPLTVLFVVGAVLTLVTLGVALVSKARRSGVAVLGGVAVGVGLLAIAVSVFGMVVDLHNAKQIGLRFGDEARVMVLASVRIEASILGLVGLVAAAGPLASGTFALSAWHGRRWLGGVLAIAILALLGVCMVQFDARVRADRLAGRFEPEERTMEMMLHSMRLRRL